jgi:hypothetical protein
MSGKNRKFLAFLVRRGEQKVRSRYSWGMRSRVGWPWSSLFGAPAHRRTYRHWWSPRHRQARFGALGRVGFRLVAVTLAATVAGGGSYAWARAHTPVISNSALAAVAVPAPAPVVDCCISAKLRTSGGGGNWVRIPLWRAIGTPTLRTCVAHPASGAPATAAVRKVSPAAARRTKAAPIHRLSLSDFFPTAATTCPAGTASVATLPPSPLPSLSPAASAVGAGR